MLLPVAAGFVWRGCNGWGLLTSGNVDAIDACTQSHYMDCNPNGWQGVLAVGLGLLVVVCLLAAVAVGVVKRRAGPVTT